MNKTKLTDEERFSALYLHYGKGLKASDVARTLNRNPQAIARYFRVAEKIKNSAWEEVSKDITVGFDAIKFIANYFSIEIPENIEQMLRQTADNNNEKRKARYQQTTSPQTEKDVPLRERKGHWIETKLNYECSNCKAWWRKKYPPHAPYGIECLTSSITLPAYCPCCGCRMYFNGEHWYTITSEDFGEKENGFLDNKEQGGPG